MTKHLSFCFSNSMLNPRPEALQAPSLVAQVQHSLLTAGSPLPEGSAGQETALGHSCLVCTKFLRTGLGTGEQEVSKTTLQKRSGLHSGASTGSRGLRTSSESQKPAVGALTFLVGRGKFLRTPFLKMTGLYSSGTLRCITGLFL